MTNYKLLITNNLEDDCKVRTVAFINDRSVESDMDIVFANS